MELDINKQNITINKLIVSKKEIFAIEGDTIVPDVKPDILNTINTSGNVCIYKKEVLDGKVRIDGSINLNVIYLADSTNDSTRGLNNVLDFSKNIELDGCRNGMNLRTKTKIKNIECKVLNGRKINTKVLLEVEIFVYSNEEISIIKEVNNLNDLQTLSSNIEINNLVGIGHTKASIKETVILNEEVLGEILKTELNVNGTETKISYNKILVKSNANVKLIYLTENGNINSIEKSFQIMGFVDMNEINENNIIIADIEMKNMLVKPNSSEQNSVYIEMEFDINCEVNDTINIQLVDDMYCTVNNLEYTKKEVNTISNRKINNCLCKVNEKIKIPEISNNKIYNVDINPIVNSVNITNGKILYDGELNLNFMFYTETNSKIDIKNYRLPFTFTIEDNNLDSSQIINTEINYLNDEFIIISDGVVECKMDLMFQIESYNMVNINVINQINVTEEKNESPSIIVYIIKSGDTLWKIAKKYKTTVDEIEKLNKIENSKNLIIGKKMFIPKYNVSLVK